MAACLLCALVGCLVASCFAEGGVRWGGDGAAGNAPAAPERGLSRQTVETITTPVAEGCFTLSRDTCCLHHDGRQLAAFRGQPCIPAPFPRTYTNGAQCEPYCWIRGECSAGVNQGDLLRFAVCAVPIGDENFTMLPRGFTCESQGLESVTQSDCEGPAKEVVGISSRTRLLGSYYTAGGCFFFPGNPNPAEDLLFVGYNQIFESSEANLMMRYICKTPP